jgi:Cof subfamily protein (haloacid dehalogenase superfamily)
MEKKLLFIDIDGTLFDNELDRVHDSTIEALKQISNNPNIYCCIASGRSLKSSNEVLNRYPLLFDGFVLMNGQIVSLNDKVIYKNPLDKSFINRFVAECQRLDIPYGFISNSLSIASSHHPLVVNSFHDFKMELPRILNKEDLENEFYQGFFFDMRYFDHFSKLFSDDVQFLSWMKNDGADIVPKGSSKAVGMEKIRLALNIKRENVYAIGDSTNDIEMVEYAQVGIAMGNAKEELKCVADYVTDSIEKDGLAKALKKYNLI